MAVEGDESKSGTEQLTFERLFDLLRIEKGQTSLQRLPENYFSSLITYLSAKAAQAKHAPASSVGSYDIAVQQLRNARKMINEIYDRREKKIISLALTKSRTESHIVDTSHLLLEEMSLYSSLVNLLREYRVGIIDQVFEFNAPFSNDAGAGAIKQSFREGAQAAMNSSIEVTEDQVNTPESAKYKILEDVPEFMGPDMTMKGPFTKDDEVDLPADIAKILLGNGHIEKI